MITRACAHMLSARANPLQVVLGGATERRRSAETDAQQLVDLEGALSRVVRSMRWRQPTSKGGV